MAEVFSAQPGRQSEFLSSVADIAIYGGAKGGGKTFALLMEAIRNVHISNYRCGIFRRQAVEISQPGGLWDTALRIYSFIPSRPMPKYLSEWHWPNGAIVSFHHLSEEKTVYNYQGSQMALLCFDQLEAFSEFQFFFMFGTNRSTCGVKPYIRATANPEPGWLADFLDWWIAPDGYADLNRAGKLRYFVRVANAIHWADTTAELESIVGRENLYAADGRCRAKSVTFIPASVYDNPALLSVNPEYIANLQNLPEHLRQRFLGDRERGGNWRVKSSGYVFTRDMFEVVDAAPAGLRRLWYWDLAATAQRDRNDPDWTAGVLMGEREGVFYVLDVIHLRASPLEVERAIYNSATRTGVDVPIRMEREGGASGVTVIDHFARRVLQGYDFDGRAPRGDKVTRSIPFCAAAQKGNVKLVRGAWVSAFLDELESFPEGSHDDQVDAATGAHTCLAELYSADPHIGYGHGYEPKARLSAEIARYDERMADLFERMSPADRARALREMTGAVGRDS